jgi:hypothetical protein
LNVGTPVQYKATAAGTSNQAMPGSIATAAARLLNQVSFGPTELMPCPSPAFMTTAGLQLMRRLI